MEQPTTAELTRGIIEALSKAAGAAGQLVHTHGHPAYIPIRMTLETIKDKLIAVASKEYGKFYKMVP